MSRESTNTIHFTKMHGLGNDFVVIDCTQQRLSLSKSTIRRMADRHQGIGFDQLLLIYSPPQTGIDFVYRIFNADGEEVAQCGNGARCFALYVYTRGLTQKRHLKIMTRARELELSIEADNQVTVNMAPPLLHPEFIPFIAPLQETLYTLSLGGEIGDIALAAIGLGNPHAVITVPSVEAASVESWGKRLQQHARFPEQANIGFMEIVDRRHIKLRVYERGVGETLACGSGACAAVVAGRLQGLLDPHVQVSLRGGDLQISWEDDKSPVFMTGPATFVFDGRWIGTT